MKSQPRSKLRNLLNLTVMASVGSGLLSLANLVWTGFAHFDEHRSEASKTLWEKRQSAYADLLNISARAASAPRKVEEYVQLHEQFYQVSGRLDVYGTEEMGDCVTTLRDSLYACAYPELPDHRLSCDHHRFHRLHLRLSVDGRKSLSRTWNQDPSEFLDDRFASELCDIK